MNRIIYETTEGGVAVIVPVESVELALKDVPEGIHYEIVNAADVPADRTFRNAWVMGDGCVGHDLGKCKAIAHGMRRQKREEEFRPLDDLIVKRIPGTDIAAVEARRQEVRDRFAQAQAAIDAATDPEQLKTALASLT